VDRDSPDVARDRLDLSGMDAGADRQAKALGRVTDGSRPPNRALGAVELSEHAVASGLDESSLMAINRGRGFTIVLSDEVTPKGGASSAARWVESTMSVKTIDPRIRSSRASRCIP